MRRRIALALLLALVFAGGLALGKKHHTTLKDVSADLDQVQDHIQRAESQIPPGTLVSLQLSMAKQSLDSARQHLSKYAEQQTSSSDKQ
jgi:hypothetical protein